MLYELITSFSDDDSISDFHIKEGDGLRLRRAGTLAYASDTTPLTREDILDIIRRNESHTGVKAKDVSDALKATGDLDLALKVGGRRFRGNLYWSNGKRLSIVLRQFPGAPPSLASIGLPPVFQELIRNNRGLLLVTGATGSGKSTTLAAVLEHLNTTTAGHIITIEDPVEYLIKSKKCTVDQRQIGRDVTSFESGLRSALRQDPDILLVGELRDPETVKTALDAANTGHLVLGTLHTNSAQQTIDRLISFFPPERQPWVQGTLSQVLLGVLSQVLVPRADGKGRVLAAEILVTTPDVRQFIREGRTHQIFNVMDTGSSRGQLLLNRNLLALLKTKVITEEQALLSTYDVNALRKELNRA